MNSALWLHSKEAHGGELQSEHWKVTLTSSHHSALNRQVTEAVTISGEGLHNLLNSKQEFGANNLTEIGVKRGVFLAGDRGKRKEREGEEREKVATEKVVTGERKQPRKITSLVKGIHRNLLEPEENTNISNRSH